MSVHAVQVRNFIDERFTGPLEKLKVLVPPETPHYALHYSMAASLCILCSGICFLQWWFMSMLP